MEGKIKLESLISGGKILLKSPIQKQYSWNLNTYELFKESLLFYTPFKASKRKIYSIIKFFLLLVYPVLKLFIKNISKGDFHKEIEKEFGVPLESISYRATDHNKFILKLIGEEKVFYCKIASELKFNSIITNELKGIKISNKRTDFIIHSGNFNGFDYFVSRELKGLSPTQFNPELSLILNTFPIWGSSTLKGHPRILQILELDKLGLLKNIKPNDEEVFNIMPEHGDFTLWNIKIDKKNIHLIDFEFFCELGVEGFDELKLVYSFGKLVLSLSEEEVIEYVKSNISKSKYLLLFPFFLLKEITQNNSIFDQDVLKLVIHES